MPRAYQIVCSGRDGKFGPGGEWTPGVGGYGSNNPGYDDLVHWRIPPLGVGDQ
jgi:hypothetical protein